VVAYTERDYKTKKELKADVAAGKVVRVYQPWMFGPDVKDGRVTLEGPHHPRPHTWYAEATIKDGVVVSIK